MIAERAQFARRPAAVRCPASRPAARVARRAARAGARRRRRIAGSRRSTGACSAASRSSCAKAAGLTIQRKAPCRPMAPDVGSVLRTRARATRPWPPARRPGTRPSSRCRCPCGRPSAAARRRAPRFASVVGRPCASSAQPSGMSRPSRAASRMWPRAATLQAMSNTIGASPGAGQPKAIGLWPIAAPREAFHARAAAACAARPGRMRRLRRPAAHGCRARPGDRRTGPPPGRWRIGSSASQSEPHGVRRRRHGPSRRRRRARSPPGEAAMAAGCGVRIEIARPAGARTYDGRRVRPCVA